MGKQKITTAGQTRVWLVENGPGPHRQPIYMGTMAIGDSDWPAGDVTPVKVPDPDHFGKFVEAGTIRGAEERMTMPITARYPEQISTLLDLRRKICRVDFHVPLGKCTNPQVYSRWVKMRIYRNGLITNWSDENAGTLDDDGQGVINETGEFSFEEMYEVIPLSFQEVAAANAVREIVDASICDSQACGDCDEESDGKSKLFLTMIGTGATPGTLPSVLYSKDGGGTWAATDIDTAFSNENPTDGECVNEFYVVTVNGSDSLHYANKEDILNGVETWFEVNAGFVTGNGPNAIFSLSGMDVWIVGDNGYIYHATDITSEVTVKDAGLATVQNLLAVHSSDSENVIATGEINALVFSSNGGDTWAALTGPAVGESLKTCWMMDEDTWFIGTNNGALWYTNDGGINWAQKALPGGVINIDKIKFFDDTVGYMTVRRGANGFILRTTDGGNSWYVMPQTGAAIPSNDYLNDIGLSPFDPNFVLSGGLNDDAATGFVVIAS